MDGFKTIEIMGISFPAPDAFMKDTPKKSCAFLDNGFCEICSCSICEGGYLVAEWKKQADLTAPMKQCSCVSEAINRKHLRVSGLSELAERCTFDSFITSEAWQRALKDKALEYLKEWKRNSFFLSGQSGSGKTHLCTAICNEIIHSGARLKYFQWIKDGTKLKTLVSDRELYRLEIKPCLSADVLYIDDFLKGDISNADLRLAFEIIDSRYISGKSTIISSERNLSSIRTKDEALAGRIYEMCSNGKYCQKLSGSDKNMRFKKSQNGIETIPVSDNSVQN